MRDEDGAAIRRRPIGPSVVRLGLDQREVEEDLDLLADEHAAGLEGLVPVEAEVRALDLADDLETDAGVAPRILVNALRDALEDDLARGAANRQVTGDAVGLLVELLDAGGPERQLRVVLDVEEVGRAKMLVALARTRGGAGGV